MSIFQEFHIFRMDNNYLGLKGLKENPRISGLRKKLTDLHS